MASTDSLSPLGEVILSAIQSIASYYGVSVSIPNPFRFLIDVRGEVIEGNEKRYDYVYRRYSGIYTSSGTGTTTSYTTLHTHDGGQRYTVTFNYPESRPPGHDAYVKMYTKSSICIVREYLGDYIICKSATLF